MHTMYQISTNVHVADIILLANSKEALQMFLDIFDDFCTSWTLQIQSRRYQFKWKTNFKSAKCTLETVNSIPLSWCHIQA